MDPIKDGSNWYVYCENNPLKFVDPDGLDFTFAFDGSQAEGFGHVTLYFQDGNGAWHSFDQGSTGDTSSGGDLGLILGLTKDAIAFTADVEGPPEGSPLINTTTEQNSLIAANADKIVQQYDNGEKNYSLYFNNCIDAAVSVVNDANAGIHIPTPFFALFPESWFKAFLNWAKNNSNQKDNSPDSSSIKTNTGGSSNNSSTSTSTYTSTDTRTYY